MRPQRHAITAASMSAARRRPLWTGRGGPWLGTTVTAWVGRSARFDQRCEILAGAEGHRGRHDVGERSDAGQHRAPAVVDEHNDLPVDGDPRHGRMRPEASLRCEAERDACGSHAEAGLGDDRGLERG